jgi:hypothetical protein
VRVESWDGVPLDANVTLPPASMPGPFPLIVDIHGWGVGKTAAPFVARAAEGVAVLSYSARGFHGSCGFPSSRVPDATLSDPEVCATRGWVHLADARYEGRDTQYLAGLLADEGLVIPDRIAATGASYGGGQTMILAALRNRTMLPDGSLVPWRSPGGRDMEIAAGAALIPFSDLAQSLVPNGATLDYRTENPYGDRGGVQKEAWVTGLYLAGRATGYYAPEGADPAADITGWRNRLIAGAPFDADPFVQLMIREITSYHSAYYIDDSVPPAPLFIYNAWTDDLFPAEEALRFWRRTSVRHPTTEFALHFANGFGHPRAALNGDVLRVATRVNQFLDRHLLGAGAALPGVEIYTQACGGSTERGPIAAAGWDALAQGEVRFRDSRAHTFDAAGGDPATAAAVGPLNGPPCRVVPAVDDPGAATYHLPPATGSGYTLVGAPTVIADLAIVGAEFAQVAARLWEVAPDGTQALVTHAHYRPRNDNLGPQVFQLAANGWHVAAGYAPKLELLGQSVPSGSAPHGQFAITVLDLELRLPVLEPPDGSALVVRASGVEPPPGPEAPDCPRAPRTGCESPRGAGTSRLVLSQGRRDAGDRLAWKWRGTRGSDPRTALDAGGYTLCLYGGDGTLRMSAPAPSSGSCGKKACWSGSGKRLRYRDPGLRRTGMRSVVVSRRGARVAAEGQGEKLGLPVLPLADLPVTLQLLDAEGGCRGATYTAPTKNKSRRFKALSD